MNKRDRVMAAVRGEAVDRPPLSFWLHNYAEENTAEALANETVRLYRTFDWDYLKPQSRALSFAQPWGLTLEPSTQRAVKPVVTRYALEDMADIASLPVADARQGSLAEQIEAFRQIRAAVGPDVPIVATIFAPLMTANFLHSEGSAGVFRLMRLAPEKLERGLETIATTLRDYAEMCMEAGVDGIFYATTAATRAQMSPEEFNRFQAPFDLHVLAGASDAPFNIVHMCGNGILADSFVDYPVQVFSWATSSDNPSLSEMHRKTGRAVMGGLPGKPAIAGMSVEALREHARRSLAEMGGRYHLLGPDCSINPDTPETLMHEVGTLLRASAQ